MITTNPHHHQHAVLRDSDTTSIASMHRHLKFQNTAHIHRHTCGAFLRLLPLLLLLPPSPAPAFGVLLPRERQPASIEQREGRVDVSIRERLATTRIRQTFFNPNPTALEADFTFPVPRGAQIVDMALSVNGKMTRAETLPQPQARKIYEDIVRQAKDPALLEWIDRDLYRVRIFPVPARGTQEIEVAYSQALEADDGLIRYRLPVQRPTIAPPPTPPEPPIRPLPRPFEPQHAIVPQPPAAPPTIGGIHPMPIRVEVQTSAPLRLVSSPTHKARIDRPSDSLAVLEFPGDALASSPARALEVHILSTEKPVAVAAVATRPRTDDDGYFSITLTPPWKAPGPDQGGLPPPPPQDLVFIIDTSGSMADSTDKIGQARRALTACLRMIRPEDRFALVRFASDVSTFRPGLVEATKDNREAAIDWVGRLEARGGTNISGALEEGLALLARDSSATSAPATVLFLTDGIANIGLTRPEDIVALLRKPGTRPVRLFAFGVGYDVQAAMLDRLALDTNGAAEYVRPEEDLEAPVSRLFNKVSLPAMTGLRLVVEGVETRDITPQRLPDLFHGTDAVILGRYRAADSDTTATVRVTGTLYGREVALDARALFPKKDNGASYVETLWATRKLAALLEAYRDGQGDGAEDLRREIEAHCLRHNLVSPLTAMLVVEDDARPVASGSHLRIGRGMAAPASSMAAPAGEATSRNRSVESAAFRDITIEQNGPALNAPVLTKVDWSAQTGREAVEASLRLRDLKAGNTAAQVADQQRPDRATVAGRAFTLKEQPGNVVIWTEEIPAHAAGAKLPEVRVVYLSPAWFHLATIGDIAEILRLGDRVQFHHRGRAILIVPEAEAKGAISEKAELEKVLGGF